jgi:hypothetical protein
MIRVSVEVREGTALSRATVQAESISEAVSVAKERYPGHHVRVTFPIEPEDFFVEGSESAEQKRRLSARPRSIVKEELDGQNAIYRL